MREVGESFARALTLVMEGMAHLDDDTIVWNLEREFAEFEEEHAGTKDFDMCPTSFEGQPDEWREFLRIGGVFKTPGDTIADYDTPVNGGAQFRRLLLACETHLRAMEMTVHLGTEHVLQARGQLMRTVDYDDVITKLLNHTTHIRLK